MLKLRLHTKAPLAVYPGPVWLALLWAGSDPTGDGEQATCCACVSVLVDPEQPPQPVPLSRGQLVELFDGRWFLVAAVRSRGATGPEVDLDEVAAPQTAPQH